MADPLWMYKLKNGLLGTPDDFGGMIGPQDQRAAQNSGLMNFGASLLANSGPSATPRSLGQSLGPAIMQGQQAQRQAGQDSLQSLLLKSQIARAGQKDRGRLIPVIGADGKPTLAYEADAEGKAPYEKTTDGKGDYQPGNYTTESWAKYLKSNDPADLVRYTSPRQEYSPSYQNVMRTLPDGSTQQGTFNTRTGEYDWKGEAVKGGTKERVEAEGRAVGEAKGAQASKAPAAASMNYVIDKLEKQIDATTQGGPLGVKGKVGSVTDYEEATRFDNLREQLSTELRTVYRIPGEGTLSDREQAQYGVQLPSRNNSSRVNKAILEDLKERTRLRLETSTEKSSDRPRTREDILKQYGVK